MARKPSSRQEEIVGALSRRSLASPFVFLPDRQGNDEPADLAWACNGCLILMYMQAKTIHQKPARDQSKRVHAIVHNLNQAQRWQRLWRTCGRVLSGDNAWHTFSIPYDPTIRVVVVSVIHCADPIVQFHEEHARDFGVRCCVTVPQSIVLRLADVGGGSLDLIALLTSFRKRANADVLSEAEAHDLLEGYALGCCRVNGVESLWPKFQPDGPLLEAGGLLLSLRLQDLARAGFPVPKPTVGLGDLNEVYNDIWFQDYLKIIVTVRDQMAELRGNPSRGGNALLLPLRHYDCGMGFAIDPSLWAAATVADAFEQWAQKTSTGLLRPGPRFVVFTSGPLKAISRAVKRDGPTVSANLLDRWDQATTAPDS